MSMYSPALSITPVTSVSVGPLSITCVQPRSRGLAGRAGSPRNSSMDRPGLQPGVDGLVEPAAGLDLDVLVKALAVGVHTDDQRPEVAHPESPQALGHEILPLDLLD